MQVWQGEAPVDGICVHCGEHTAGRALCGASRVAAGAAGVGVVGVVAVSLSGWQELMHDLDQVGASIGFADVGGRESQVSGIIEDRYGLAGNEWKFLVATSLVLALCTLGGTLVEVVMFSIGM